MDKLYVFYVMVDFDPGQDTYITGIQNRLNLVIAESEDAAVQVMKKHVSPHSAQVYLPNFSSSDEAAAVGHGSEISEFLTDPASKVDSRTLIDLYRNKYNNYYGHSEECSKDINLMLWDEQGQVQILNDYIHGTYKKKEPDGSSIGNTFVIITGGQEDKLEGGIAFVGSNDTSKTESGEDVITSSNDLLISNATQSQTPNGSQLIDNLQVKLTAKGEILVRQWFADTETWSDWELSPIFAEEAPSDGKQYVRVNTAWSALKYDNVLKDGSNNLATSGTIKTYVDNAVVKVYRYKGSSTVEELNALTDCSIGDVYNVIDEGTLTLGDDPINVTSGDNVVWEGTHWDNLKGFFDHSSYVTFNDYASESRAGVIKVAENAGLVVDDSGNISVKISTNTDIEEKASADSIITPANIDYAVIKSTHQEMSDEYNVDNLTTSSSVSLVKGSLPVSYDGVKNYIDTKISEIEVPESSDTAEVDLTEYQKITDKGFNTAAKTVAGAIGEVNDKVDIICANLTSGWNVVKLNKTYPVSWIFAGKPFCYTSEGDCVDFKIRNFNNYVTDGVHSFEIYVETDCTLNCAVSSFSEVSGVSADYMVISYYYTGNDGKDLDTVTEAVGVNEVGHAGYGFNTPTIKDNNGNILAKWAGDNTGGGVSEGDNEFYEEVILDLNAINAYDSHDLDISIYGGWYSAIGDGNIHVKIACYKGSVNIDELPIIDKRFNLSSLDEPTYTNPTELSCYIPSKVTRGDATNYKTTYTKAFSVTVHHTAASGNTCSFSIKRLA